MSNAQTRPPFVSDRLWTQVIDDNPDPTKMVPVLANGFGDLSARRNWQNEHQQAQRSKLAELEQRLSSLLTRQDLDVSTQLQVIQRQQLKLTLRVLQLMRKVEVMRRTGQRLAGNEQALLGKLQDLQSQLLRPSSSTHPNATRQMETQLQTLLESGRLDPLSSLRQTVVSDDTAQATLQSVLSLPPLLMMRTTMDGVDFVSAAGRSQGNRRGHQQDCQGFRNDAARLYFVVYLSSSRNPANTSSTSKRLCITCSLCIT